MNMSNEIKTVCIDFAKNKFIVNGEDIGKGTSFFSVICDHEMRRVVINREEKPDNSSVPAQAEYVGNAFPNPVPTRTSQ